MAVCQRLQTGLQSKAGQPVWKLAVKQIVYHKKNPQKTSCNVVQLWADFPLLPNVPSGLRHMV